jgi:hypothetical protein
VLPEEGTLKRCRSVYLAEWSIDPCPTTATRLSFIHPKERAGPGGSGHRRAISFGDDRCTRKLAAWVVEHLHRPSPRWGTQWHRPYLGIHSGRMKGVGHSK